MGEELLTVAEVAERLRMAPITIYRWIEEGTLPALQIAKHYRIREADLDEVIQSSVRTGAPEPWGRERRESVSASEASEGRGARLDEQRREAFSADEAAAAKWAEAMRAHIEASPDDGFAERLRGLAAAARMRARATRAADPVGLKWVPHPGAVRSEPPRELRPGSGRVGPPDLWERFDGCVSAYNRAVSHTSAGGVADAADALADTVESLVDAVDAERGRG